VPHRLVNRSTGRKVEITDARFTGTAEKQLAGRDRVESWRLA
jgi:hypothetical protein